MIRTRQEEDFGHDKRSLDEKVFDLQNDNEKSAINKIYPL